MPEPSSATFGTSKKKDGKRKTLRFHNPARADFADVVEDSPVWTKEQQEYALETLCPVLKSMLEDLVAEFPGSPIDFMIRWLRRRRRRGSKISQSDISALSSKHEYLYKSIGACVASFSLVPCLEPGICAWDLRGSNEDDDPIPHAVDEDGMPQPWTFGTELYHRDGTPVSLGIYLTQKAEEGVRSRPEPLKFKEILEQPEVSETPDFQRPFRVFASTLNELMASDPAGGDRERLTHEAAWPLCCWDCSYGLIADMLRELRDGTLSDDVLNDVVHSPVLVHVSGSVRRDMIPISTEPPGVSPWGVKDETDDGYFEQVSFWAASPQSLGCHTWRILAEPSMYRVKGSYGFGVLIQLLRSANVAYRANLKPGASGQPSSVLTAREAQRHLHHAASLPD